MTRPPIADRPALVCLVAVAVAGCQSTQYRAATLPAELRVAPTAAAPQIQLANLAADAAPSTAIAEGDVLKVWVVSGLEEQPPAPLVLQVSPSGAIDLPLVGPVAVQGMEPAQASRALAQAAQQRGVYRRPNITLAMHTRAAHRVTVLGAVETPGTYELPIGGCNVLTAIAAAGGLNEEAGTKVQVMHHTGAANRLAGPGAPPVRRASHAEPAPVEAAPPRIDRIDLALADGGASRAKAGGARALGDRDVVMVMPTEKRIFHVTGLVKSPAQFELPVDQDIRVLDAVAMAGGVASNMADKVLVIRQVADGSQEPAVIEVSLSRAKRDPKENLVIGRGDLVTVESTAATTMTDVLKNFFRVTMGITDAAFNF